jgi:translation initiation factor IF-3
LCKILKFLWRSPIRKPHRAPVAVEKDGPRVNEMIRNREIMLVDNEGVNQGVTNTREAIAMAAALDLDLVEVAPNAEPPVCKIMDYGKYKFEQQKKAAEARRNQKIVEIKEIKFRPGIDDHDYDVKLRAIKRFIEEGDKVKITLKFRGREMAHVELGYKLLNHVKVDIVEYAKIEMDSKLDGKQMMMILAPK